VTSPDFNEAAWIEGLGVALEQVAAEARPHCSSPPLDLSAFSSSDGFWGGLRSA